MLKKGSRSTALPNTFRHSGTRVPVAGRKSSNARPFDKANGGSQALLAAVRRGPVNNPTLSKNTGLGVGRGPILEGVTNRSGGRGRRFGVTG